MTKKLKTIEKQIDFMIKRTQKLDTKYEFEDEYNKRHASEMQKTIIAYVIFGILLAVLTYFMGYTAGLSTGNMQHAVTTIASNLTP